MVRPDSSTAAATFTSLWVSTPTQTSLANPGAVALDLSRNRLVTGSFATCCALASLTGRVLPSLVRPGCSNHLPAMDSTAIGHALRFSHQESVPVEGRDRRRWP